MIKLLGPQGLKIPGFDGVDNQRRWCYLEYCSGVIDTDR